jgi:hypothetical protein
MSRPPFRPIGNGFRRFGHLRADVIDFSLCPHYTTAMMIKQVLNDLRT